MYSSAVFNVSAVVVGTAVATAVAALVVVTTAVAVVSIVAAAVAVLSVVAAVVAVLSVVAAAVLSVVAAVAVFTVVGSTVGTGVLCSTLVAWADVVASDADVWLAVGAGVPPQAARLNNTPHPIHRSVHFSGTRLFILGASKASVVCRCGMKYPF